MRLYLLLLLLMLASPSFAQEHIIKIYKKKIIPAVITIEQGDRVTWKNFEKRQYHNVWFKQFDQEEPGYFFPDESYQRSFNQSGDFTYECGPHPRMKGKVIVIAQTK